jgi:hypothetical protein
MADTSNEAFAARWQALFTREQVRLADYDAGSPNLLDRLERLDGRMEALMRGTDERQRQQEQGMGY